MKKHMLITVIAILVIVPFGVYAYSVSSMKSLYRAVDKKRLAIAMFYRSARDQRKENRALYDAIKKAQSDFAELSKVSVYKRADLQCIQANVEQKDLQEAPAEFGITVKTEPVYVLLDAGKPMKAGVQKGFLSTRQLRNFIDRNMSDALQDYLDDKEERERRARAESGGANVYFGIGGGYPWYGWYPYYGGWGYPYGGYYGGNVGFGVSFGF